jgi:hypothetical protein
MNGMVGDRIDFVNNPKWLIVHYDFLIVATSDFISLMALKLQCNCYTRIVTWLRMVTENSSMEGLSS